MFTASADRRPVDPPPVVELKVFEVIGPNPAENLDDKLDITFAYDANFFLFATLELARPIAHGRVAAPAASQVPVLTGMPVSGMAYLDRPCEAGYFIFPDLSVRHEGKYRLSFNLYEETKRPDKDADKEPALDSKPALLGGQHDPEASFDWRMELKSDVFDVFSAKKFPGLAESTHLSRMVAEQGCRVRIRRDVRMRRRGDGKSGGDFDEDEVYERQSRAPTVTEEFQKERSRSSSSGSEGDRRQAYNQPQSHLGFLDGQQFQQPQFAAPQPPMQSQHYAPPPPSYRQQPQYGQPAPQAHMGYERPHPQSAYPSTQPRELLSEDDRWRRASMAGHPTEQFPRHYSQEPNFSPRQPFQGYAPQSPAPGLPPLQMHLSGKYDNSTAPLPPVRSIAPALHSPTYERKEERFGSYPQHSAPLVPAIPPEPARNGGKRSFDTTFGSAASKAPLYNGMRPSSPHDDGSYDDDDDASFIEDMLMKYKRADGSEYSRGLPTLG